MSLFPSPFQFYFENFKDTAKLKDVSTCHLNSTVTFYDACFYPESIHLSVHRFILFFDTFQSKLKTSVKFPLYIFAWIPLTRVQYLSKISLV